jgi:colanic acid/amylovoran biosynthesis glycosyltransferase
MSRVLLVCNQFPKFSESFIVRKFLGLLRLGWDVHVACNRSEDEQWAHFAHILPRADYEAHVHRSTSFDQLLLDLAPDLVHFEFGHLARGRAGSPALGRAKVVASLRGNDINALGLDDPTYFEEVWERVDALHVLTPALFERAVARGCPPDLPHVVVPPAVDASFFAPAERRSEEVGTPERPFRILSVGRLHWMKGYASSLNAIAMLRMRGIKCEYRIAGAADYGEGIIEVLFAIHDQGLQDVVELLGAGSQNDVKDELDWADVLLHGAISEGFCNAALEAQAMAVPVVCTEALAANVLDGRTGLVAPLRDAAGLADRLARLATDSELRRRLGEAGRNRAETQFRPDDQIARFSDWYRDVLATGLDHSELRTMRILLRRQRTQLEELELERERLARDIDRREGAEAMKDLVDEFVPDEDPVLVVSRGDPALIDIGRTAGHFPQTIDGAYLGHHPASSIEAIEQLEHLRATDAARFLVFPRTGLWWLQHYRGLRDHLDRNYTRAAFDDQSGAIYDLRGRIENRDDLTSDWQRTPEEAA